MKKKLFITVTLILMHIYIVGVTYSDEPKDHFKAFLLSFALPGLGQYYAESPGNAKIFIAAELAIWGGYYYNKLIEKSYRQDFLSQAAHHAGVNPSGFGASYLNALGSFDSSFEYNQYQLQIYKNPELYTGSSMWEWDSGRNRSYFKKLRERELDYKNYARYCTAGIILNHFLSGLNASKLVRTGENKRTALTVNILDEGLLANYSWSF